MKTQGQLKIETERLILVPMTYKFVSRLLEDDIRAYDEFQIKPNTEWPNVDTKEIMPIFKEKLSKTAGPDGFLAWLFIDKTNGCIIGDGGFKDKPNSSGQIDLGYGTVYSKRRQGYTFEAVQALVKWAFSQKNVKEITADCLINNDASYNLLIKLGMIEIKRDDELIYFLLNTSE
jgi:ribosomal-protein-alanine N-acetyltransferase